MLCFLLVLTEIFPPQWLQIIVNNGLNFNEKS